MGIENLDWQNRVIFVPDSKTAEGATCSKEPSRQRSFACTLWYRERGMGVSIQPFRF
jgi:hypothetical protein